MLYLHGGGLVAGDLDTHAIIAQCARALRGVPRDLAWNTACARSTRFPPRSTMLLRRHHTYCALTPPDFGIDAARLGICGDSAGGTLAAAACQAAAARGVRALALQLLLCPILDYSRAPAPGANSPAAIWSIRRPSITTCALRAPAVPIRPDPRLSPLRADRPPGVAAHAHPHRGIRSVAR